jgi:tetratricopeptide (TPR) repeat protein
MHEILIAVREHDGAPAATVRRFGGGASPATPLPEFAAAQAGELRWLLEDNPRLSPTIAAAPAAMAETRLRFFARQLHDALAKPLQAAIGDGRLEEIAFSISDPDGVTRNWPWELLEHDELAVALQCHSFTRRTGQRPSRLSAARPSRPLRALIVVSRPAGVADVAFRSVASRVLQATANQAVEVELLRPPTHAALRERLIAAKDAGAPFDIVHFDGHGSVQDTASGPRGVLHFENAAASGTELVGGDRMGAVLAAADVPLLILNACHSAASPEERPAESAEPSGASFATASLAERIASCGAIDVVSMSHAVEVETAAQIVYDIYRCLDMGRSIGEAVAFARRRWSHDAPERGSTLGYCIVQHFGCPAESSALEWPPYDRPSRQDDATPADLRLQQEFQRQAPFVAADDSVLLLERALRSNPIVQLNGMRGSGKTSLMLELGRWLAASKTVDPERIRYIDLEHATPSGALAQLQTADAGVLLIDHADRVQGDSLRREEPWAEGEIAAFAQDLESKCARGVQILLASSGWLAFAAQAGRVIVQPLTLADMRTLIALNSGTDTAARVPEPALHWSAGLPSLVPVLIERVKTGHFDDAGSTLEALAELSVGRFATTQPPLDLILPLQMHGGADLFVPDVGLPWLLMQFQGQATLMKFLWQLAQQQGLNSLNSSGNAPDALPMLVEKLERAGLLLGLDAENLLLHPLLPCLVAHPYNERQLGTQGYFRSLKRVQILYAQYIQLLGAMFSGDRRAAGHARGWDSINLLHAFQCLSGDAAAEHMGALSLARRLRTHFLEAKLPDFWACTLRRLEALFEKHPPPPDDGQFNPWSELKNLLAEEASRRGDEALALRHAGEAFEIAQRVPDSAAAQGANLYDVGLKSGRLLSEKDPDAALAMFNAALEAAGDSGLRRAKVQLELMRLLRSRGHLPDLLSARDHGEKALSTYREFAKAGLATREDITLTATSLSVVYKALAGREDAVPEYRTRGEALCRESLDLAEYPAHQATSWYNLGGWRYSARDHREAAAAFLEAANLYESLNNTHLLGNSLAYRSACLLTMGDLMQARVVAVRAATLLAGKGVQAERMLLFAHQIGEEAQAKLTQVPDSPPT